MSAVEDLLSPVPSDGLTADCIAFVSDNQTHDVLTSVLGEHFVEPSIREGSTTEVIEYLSEAPPPLVLIVDLADAGSPLTAIMSLTAALPEETRIIGIGDVNDIALYRDIVDAGAIDYVVKPVTEKALSAALQRTKEHASTTQDAPAEQKQNRIAVFGSRGGAGASMVATSLAWVISEELERRTVLVDLDLEFGTIALSLDLEPTRGLREALENPSRIDSLFISSATAKLTDTLSVMATEETLADDIHFNPNAIDVLFETLGRSCDTIVIDVPRPSFTVRQKVMEASTRIILVTETTLSGLRDSIRLLASVEEIAPDTPVTVIANRTGGPAQAMPIGEFQKALGRKIDHHIPDESKLLNKAANSGKPLVQQDKRGKVAKEIQKLAKEVGGGSSEDQKKKSKGGFARLFKGK